MAEDVYCVLVKLIVTLFLYYLHDTEFHQPAEINKKFLCPSLHSSKIITWLLDTLRKEKET